jgi:hypothetical protein
VGTCTGTRGDALVNVTKPLKAWFCESSTGETPAGLGRLVLAAAGRVLSELAGRVAARKTAGTAG